MKNCSLVLLLLLSLTATAQKSHKKVKILPVPAIGYSPETQTYVGAVSLFTIDFYNDSITRKSNAKIEFNYTWRNQIIFESEWDYFFKEEKWFTKGRLRFSDYPDFYYGIGSNTLETHEVAYNSTRFEFDISVLKGLDKKWFVGPVIKIRNLSGVEQTSKENEISFPELKSSSVYAMGASLLQDSRNSILSPLEGTYAHLMTSYNWAETNYWKFLFDIRYYKTWRNKFTLANRFFNEFTTNTPPFYDYSMLGGDKYIRGYYYGRYRDNNLSTLQSEFRFPVWKRIRMAAFGGVSNLYSNQNSFKLNNSKYNYGLGLRYLVDKKDKTYLRLDYAMGQDNNDGFYISFGESF